MTASTFTIASCTTTIAHRPVVDILVERLAMSLLSWSERRAVKNQLTHERMALILETERNLARGGSSLDR